MSDTIWVAIITALPTLIIAFFTSFFQYKLKKTDSTKNMKYEVLKDFNSKASEYYSVSCSNYKSKYEVALNNLLIYFPKANTNFINELDKARSLQDWNKYYPTLHKTIKYLSKFI